MTGMQYYIDEWFSEEISAVSEQAQAINALGECSADLVINWPLERMMGNIWQLRDFYRVKAQIAQRTADIHDGHELNDWAIIEWETRRAEAHALKCAIAREHEGWSPYDDSLP